MKNRREFLQLSVAALAVPMSVHTALSADSIVSHEPALAPLYKIVFDNRFSASLAFAHEAESLGASVHGISGDVTDLWFHDLYYRWRKSPAAIAGLTGYGSLFCLERLARDQGLRVVFRAEHSYRPDGRLEHRVWGPTSMLQQAAGLEASGPNWGSRVAGIVTRFQDNPLQASQRTIVTETKKRATDPEYLVSWVIAPAGSAQR